MSKIQIKSTQIKSLSVKNEQIASDAAISLSKIDGGVDLQNRVGNLENDAFVTREVPSGPVDGSNVTFTLANSPVAGSEQVYLNGLLQDPGVGNSYTISGGTITFASAPLSGDEIHVSYATGTYMVAPGGAGSGGSGGSGSLYVSPSQPYAFNSQYTITHNLGVIPSSVQVVLTNTSTGAKFILSDFYTSGGAYYGYDCINVTNSELTLRTYGDSGYGPCTFEVFVIGGAGGGSASSGSSAIVYQDAEFTWVNNPSGSIRTITHNFGRRPDLIEVWQYFGGQWINSIDYDATPSYGQGWLVMTGGENTNNKIDIGLYASYGFTNNPCRIRLYWFTDTDVANFSSAGGFVNAISGGGSGAGFTYTDSPVFTWPGNTSGNPTVQTYTHNHGTFPDKIEVLIKSSNGGFIPAVSLQYNPSGYYGIFVINSSINQVDVAFYGDLTGLTPDTKIRCFWYN